MCVLRMSRYCCSRLFFGCSVFRHSASDTLRLASPPRREFACSEGHDRYLAGGVVHQVRGSAVVPRLFDYKQVMGVFQLLSVFVTSFSRS